MFERVPLPETWPVYVTWAEANAFARWRGLGCQPRLSIIARRLGRPMVASAAIRGEKPSAIRSRGNFDFNAMGSGTRWRHPEGASAFGVHDLIGNGWEWTATTFGPFDGFEPLPTYPEYSADFFDGDHFVMKGASPLTARTLVRRGFRNWFRPRYPYVYATFRCAGEA